MPTLYQYQPKEDQDVLKKINILQKKKKKLYFLYTVNISIRIEIKSFVQQKNPTLYKLPMRCEIYGHHI